jgi:hypothetical protein
LIRAQRVLIFTPTSFTQAVSRTVCAPSGLISSFRGLTREIALKPKEVGHAASSKNRSPRI